MVKRLSRSLKPGFVSSWDLKLGRIFNDVYLLELIGNHWFKPSFYTKPYNKTKMLPFTLKSHSTKLKLSV